MVDLAMFTPLRVLALILILVVVLMIRTQNRLAPLRELIDEASSNLKTSIAKRNRVIRQLIEIAGSYANHERDLYSRISSDFNSSRDVVTALAYISRLVNTFPELKADRTYLSLTKDLSSLESELQCKYEQHNARVREYNIKRLSFPTDWVAGIIGFGVVDYIDSNSE